MKREEWIGSGFIVAIFGVAVWLTDPRGNFPLDDDWDFTLTTWNFVQNGVIQHTPFTSAIAVLQYLWGALWTVAFGASCTVLRFSTLTLSLVSTLLIFTILRRAGVAPALAVFCALAFLFNPLIFWASFTYMTHVPELVLSVAAFALFAEALRRESDAWLAAAVLASVASFFVRQIGIVNAATPFIVALLYRRTLGDRWRKIALVYGAACALFAGLMVTGVLIVSRQELQLHMQRFDGSWSELLASKVIGPAHYAFFNFQYAALFFLPLVILALTFRISRAWLAVLALWFLATATHMLLLDRPIPYPARGNVFIDFALGPPTLRDTFVFRMAYPFHAAQAWLIALTVITATLAVLLAAMVLTLLRRSELPLLARVAAVYCLSGTLVMMFMRIYFDRYSIDTMWPVALLVPLATGALPRPRSMRAIALTSLIVMATLSVAGTAEYLSWNRARWTAFRWLQSRGVTLEQMDGGYEINALLAIRTGQKFLGKEGFAVHDDRYILAFNEVPGYLTLARFPYPRMLGPDGVVRAMRRRE